MTSRRPILLALFGAVLATVVVEELRTIAGPYAALIVLFGYGGVGLAVAFLVGWPEVRELREKGDGEP